jgi:hypothetical protein
VEAAQMALYKGEKYSVWVPNGTVLEVWKVGPVHDYMRSEKRSFVVHYGQALVSILDSLTVEGGAR